MPKFKLHPDRRMPFRRTLKIAGRAPRLVLFDLDGESVQVDRAEARVLARDVAAGSIVAEGFIAAVVSRLMRLADEPKLDPLEDDRDSPDEKPGSRPPKHWYWPPIPRSH